LQEVPKPQMYCEMTASGATDCQDIPYDVYQNHMEMTHQFGLRHSRF